MFVCLQLCHDRATGQRNFLHGPLDPQLPLPPASIPKVLKPWGRSLLFIPAISMVLTGFVES